MAEMNKKGILLTLGLTLFILVVFSLVLVYSRFMQDSEDRFLEFSLMDKLYDTDTSIQKGFKDLFTAYSGINISFRASSVSFEENLPNSGGTFLTSVEDYKNFVESQDTNVHINTSLLSQELPLIIFPHNITYTHKNLGGKQIEVIPASINFDNYSLYLRFDENITNCVWNVNPGTLTLAVASVGTSANTCTDTRTVDPQVDTNVVKINNITIKITSGGRLVIANNGTAIFLRTEISSSRIPQEAFSVKFPEQLLTINFSEFNIMKKSKVSLL
ncbi:hypothetical protein HY643_03630 [Candidatus Woesearchaeota archaeon]|nr:hypothetical protein [Candidatus Woesearchaeota archaeon]